jgi:hypothetical protein
MDHRGLSAAQNPSRQGDKLRKTLIFSVLTSYLVIFEDYKYVSNSESRKLFEKGLFFVNIMKATEEKSRIRIRSCICNPVEWFP